MKSFLTISRTMLSFIILGAALIVSVIVFHNQINRYLNGHAWTKSAQELRS